MLDSTNTSIILCSHELEDTLNMKALHVSEIRSARSLQQQQLYKYIFFRGLVLKQLEKLPDVPPAPPLHSGKPSYIRQICF